MISSIPKNRRVVIENTPGYLAMCREVMSVIRGEKERVGSLLGEGTLDPFERGTYDEVRKASRADIERGKAKLPWHYIEILHEAGKRDIEVLPVERLSESYRMGKVYEKIRRINEFRGNPIRHGALLEEHEANLKRESAIADTIRALAARGVKKNVVAIVGLGHAENLESELRARGLNASLDFSAFRYPKRISQSMDLISQGRALLSQAQAAHKSGDKESSERLQERATLLFRAGREAIDGRVSRENASARRRIVKELKKNQESRTKRKQAKPRRK
jgi:hypothetical protein